MRCGGWGKIKITGCPVQQVPRDVWDLLFLADLAKHGKLPLDGGVLDQTKSFIDGYRQYLSLDGLWRASKGIPE